MSAPTNLAYERSKSAPVLTPAVKVAPLSSASTSALMPLARSFPVATKIHQDWAATTNADGTVYYYNVNTRESTWNPPLIPAYLGINKVFDLKAGPIKEKPTLTISTSHAQGSSMGQFRSPSAVCVNSKGFIIVADTGNNRLQIFDPKGKYMAKGGSHGSTRGDFESLLGLAMDDNDQIYVVDQGNHRVQVMKFDNIKNGNISHVRNIGERGDTDGKLSNPHGVCIDNRNGNVLITDKGNNRVQIFDKDGKFLHKFGKQGLNPGELDKPMGIGLTSKGEIVVTGQNDNRIQVFDYEGQLIRQAVNVGGMRHIFISQSSPNPPTDQYADDIYVANEGKGEIQILNSETLDIIDSIGHGVLERPLAVCIDHISNRILVANTDAHTINAFSQTE